MPNSNAFGWLGGRGCRVSNANLNHVTWSRVQILNWPLSVVV